MEMQLLLTKTGNPAGTNFDIIVKGGGATGLYFKIYNWIRPEISPKRHAGKNEIQN
jgi:hypothetical protein